MLDRFFVFSRRAVATIAAALCFVAISTTSLCAQTDGGESDDSAATAATEPVESRSVAERDCDAIFAEYQEKLRQIAALCDERSMTLEAKITRSLLYEETPYCFNAPFFPEKKAADALPDDASSEQRSWFAALARAREKYGAETFALAEKYGAQKRGFDVVACALTTLFIDPDHEKARRFFDCALRDGRWRTDWEIRRLDAGLVDSPEFGWLPADRVERYRKGERFYRGEWISAQEEAAAILAGSSGWKIETEHFSILSRVSLERGVEIGRFLETYYRSWNRLFYRFIATEKRWAARLYSDSPVVSKRHKIILYRDRDEYLRELSKHDANVKLSVGGYFPNMKCIFVYEPGPDDEFQLLPLLAHEATHQLFSECNSASVSGASRGKSASANLGRYANYWGVEGVAIYMETYRPGKTSATIGGYRGVFRIERAFESLFDDKTYIPLRRYAALSMKEFQHFDDLQLLYTQGAGLAFFFLHYRDGIYRNAFVAYLYLIYQGRDAVESLEKLTGKSFEELDAQYAAFMKELRESAAPGESSESTEQVAPQTLEEKRVKK